MMISTRYMNLVWPLLAAGLIGGCGHDHDHDHDDEPGAWACDATRNGQTRCGANGQVQSCHGTEQGPHFHNKQDCAASGLTCMEMSQGSAACVAAQVCEASETRCEGGQAYTCVDGALTVATCGTLQVCEVSGGAATCVLSIDPEEACGGHGELHDDHCHCDEGYAPAPGDALTCVAVAPDPDPDPDPEVCGGHGELHDDHCRCEAGYEIDPDDAKNCVAATPVTPGGFAFNVTRSNAVWGPDDEGTDAWVYTGQAGNRAQIYIENLVQYGGHSSTGDYTIRPEDQSYATCGFCVVLETACHSHGDQLHCEKTYMPKAGSYKLTQLDRVAGGKFAGTLEDVVFQQVTINQNTLATTPVAGAAELRFAMSFAWDGTLRVNAPPAEECSGHGHLHGNVCHCDAGYRLDPQDPTKCIQ